MIQAWKCRFVSKKRWKETRHSHCVTVSMQIIASSLVVISSKFTYCQNAQYLYKHKWWPWKHLKITFLCGCNSILERTVHFDSLLYQSRTKEAERLALTTQALTSSPSSVFALTLFHSKPQDATNTRQASPKPKYHTDLRASL
jgi:hypothetical protein